MTGPLNGVKVLDLTRTFAGPFCSLMFAEMGADVIKVEHPDGGDETREWPPVLESGVSGYFAALNRSKKSITLNLKHPDGRKILYELAEWADIFIENFTPGVADRLGIGYDELSQRNNGLIYCSISGFGQTGPYRNRRGYDPVLQAMGGLMGVTGEKGGGPVKSMIPMADISTGVFTAVALLAALNHRNQTGKGQYVDMSMLDVMVSQLTTVGALYLHQGIVPPRSGTENPARVPSAAFLCADDKYIQLVPNQRQWPVFCEVLGIPEIASDPRFADNLSRIKHQDELYPLLRKIMASRPSAEWMDLFVEAGIPAGPIHTLDTLFEDPQVLSRGMLTEIDHPVAGAMKAINLPFKFSASPTAIQAPPPELGEHTEHILQTVLGYSADEIVRLREEGVV